MSTDENLKKIQNQFEKKDYLVLSPGDSKAQEDIGYLLELIAKQTVTLLQLEKKTEVLRQQNLELTTEMENIRSDFGGDFR